ncbi:hypothetical protein ACIQZG_15080 [Lysinibacillus sp. NPDC096418]|uniref:hypothetical protein n=1 Tax=Lysinibacillus sp. NPDC096418 TaxID=3364138 RepID=UPI003803FD42
MYSIQNFKQLADLKEELESLKSKTNQIVENEVHPAMESAIKLLYKEMMKYLETNGLEVLDNGNSFVASYKNGTIRVSLIGILRSLKITVNSQEVDKIDATVIPERFQTAKAPINPDEFEKEIDDIQEEIENYKALLYSYSSLNVVYKNKSNIVFATAEQLIKDYFG